MLLNIKCPQLSEPKARQQWQGTKTPSGDWIEKKNLGRTQAQLGPVVLWPTYILFQSSFTESAFQKSTCKKYI